MASPCTDKELGQPSASAESLFPMTGVFGVGCVGGPQEGTSSVLAAAEDQDRCASSSSGNVFGGSTKTRGRSFDDDFIKMFQEKEEGEDGKGDEGDVAAAVIDTRLAASSAPYKIPPQPQELLEAIMKVKSPGIAFDGTNRLCSFLLENSHMLGDAIDLASNMKGEALLCGTLGLTLCSLIQNTFCDL